MKKKYKMIAKVVLILAIGIWIFSVIPFNQKLTHEISAGIYEDGVVTRETTVLIDGEKSNYLFRDDDSFEGEFHILSYKKTGGNGMKANIKWDKKHNIQKLLYFQNATFPSMDIIHELIINEQMTEFALMLKDGSVIATSDDLYELYIKHIYYDSGTDSTHIKEVNKIPKIE